MPEPGQHSVNGIRWPDWFPNPQRLWPEPRPLDLSPPDDRQAKIEARLKVLEDEAHPGPLTVRTYTEAEMLKVIEERA